jgi:hypothetical protein
MDGRKRKIILKKGWKFDLKLAKNQNCESMPNDCGKIV